MALAASIKDFLLSALRVEQRLDGRRPLDSRRLTVKFAREDGAAEVRLGQTHIICNVSCQLAQPYPDQPNEGMLVIYTEFSPMADPTFEAGRPGEIAVELGRIIDRGLRESRAIDTESLCVLSGKAVWAIRLDISVLDNGGNLIDAASIAALAALLSFRRPECSITGTERRDVVVHPPEGASAIDYSLPANCVHIWLFWRWRTYGILSFLRTLGFIVVFSACLFALLSASCRTSQVMDPSYKEELVMRGRLTVILDVQGDICAIQKGGGVGVTQSDILRCLRIASSKVADTTSYLKKEAEAHELERTQRKIKRHQKLSAVEDVRSEDIKISENVHLRHDLQEAEGSPGSSDIDSNSTESIDDSASNEEEKASVYSKKGTRAIGRLREQPCFPLRKDADDADEVFFGGPARQDAEMLGEAHGYPVSEELTSLVSEKLQGIGLQTSSTVGSIEGGAFTSSKGKPQSLLDAVKWSNVKKTRPV